MPKSTVHRVGINDADYKVKPVVNGVRQYCKYYSDWQSMLQRGYSKKYKDKYPTYANVSVCQDWWLFSNFRKWAVNQEKLFNIDCQYFHLDKDIITKGNKEYSPENCAYITGDINKAFLDWPSRRGDYPLGVYYEKSSGRFVSQLGFSGSTQKKLGRYDCPLVAHQHWQAAKIKVLGQLKDKETNLKVISGLNRIIGEIAEDLKQHRITERVNA